MLLNADANVKAKTDEGYTALHFGVDNTLHDHGEEPLRVMQLIVERGADLEARQHYGWTPLVQAILEGSIDEMPALLQLGAKPFTILPDQTTPSFLSRRSSLGA